MRTLTLLAGLACACDAHRVQKVEDDAESNTITADGATKVEEATTKAYDGTTIASWESTNFARYSTGELNDAELGMANLIDAVRDPLALSQMKQMLSHPESLAEMKKTMASPSFKAQAARVLKKSFDSAGMAQEHGFKAGVREWELENTASYTAGKSSLAELGATNLLAAIGDPSVMAEAVQMLRNPDNVAALQQMRSHSSFQQEAKRVAKEVATASKDAPQSLAQVSEAKAQGGVDFSYNPMAKAALGSLLLASNPAAAFNPAAPVSHVGGPSRAAMSMQAGKERSAGQAGRVVPKPGEFGYKKFNVEDLAGVTEPLGFWDPTGIADDKSEGKIRFFREVELKHGRVAMLAALGFLVAEQFHPLFGGDIDVPSYLAFQQTPLQSFWPAVVAAIAIPEIYSVQTFERAEDSLPANEGGQWLIRSDHEPGDFGFDPLGLKPENAEELKELQTKELNNGRLAMLATAGMVAQELATGQKLFGPDGPNM